MNEPPPLAFPGGPEPDWMRRQLFERRTLLVSGALDEETAGDLSAALMTLDALADDPIQMQFDVATGTTGAALALMDVIDLCGVPVRALGLGEVAGPAVGVFAVCHHRTVSPHVRLRLSEPRLEAEGRAHQLERLAEAHLDQWAAFCTRLSEAAGQPEPRLRRDAAEGRFFSAPEAVAYGLADEIAAPDARVLRLPGRRMGFGPD